ncbi:MAG: hypothetical protein AUG84_01935 [Chloroflexi bacterium 13_1_20CM_4_66_7]|nr:MAG: hypothetical protein AUG84_01935 [Chloroflexi bacterium 13_1_20CM_4_66_7]
MSDHVTLVDEGGVERRFKLHDAFDLDAVAYYLVEDADDPERVMLLRESASGLETVDGDEFKRVMEALEKDIVE